MSASLEVNEGFSAKMKQNESKTLTDRKKKRQEWWQKNQKSRDLSRPASKNADDNKSSKDSEQISKLRDRQSIAKPDNLQYDHNLSRGFHAKILHSLYNDPVKKKREDEKRKAKKRPSQKNSQDQQAAAKKAKVTTPAPPPAQQTDYFDSYAFSMNLINGEVEKVKAEQKQLGKTSNNKYVLFIGNLPHDITREQLEEHFRKTGGIKAIRIPRERGNDKGRGFAYMEFDGRISHGIALRLHQTTLGGRKINVEFTSIGGGKSVDRKEKLKRKNERRKRMKMS